MIQSTRFSYRLRAELTRQERDLLLLFLGWPFLGFLVACSTFRRSSSQLVVFAFFVLYGLTFIIIPGMDAEQYGDALRDAHEKPFDYVYIMIDSLYVSSLDIAEPLITFLISRVTDSYHVLFATFASIFGFFYVASIRQLYGQLTEQVSYNALPFLLFFPWIIPIFEINGFRMWTACWIFFYGAYNVLFFNRRSFFIIVIIAPFVHFSMIGPILILVIWLVFGNRKIIYFSLAAVTFFVSELEVERVREIATLLGSAFETKVAQYTHQEYVAMRDMMARESSWFIKLSHPLLLYFVLFQLCIIFFRSFKIRWSQSVDNLFAFSLLLLSYCNIASLLSSGGRFYSLFYLFAVAMLYCYYLYYHRSSHLEIYNLIGFAPMLLFILIKIRIASDTINTVLLFPSALMPFSYDLNWSLSEWLF